MKAYNMEKQNIPWEALSAKLKEEATKEQISEIQQWLDVSPENAILLSEIVNTWKLTRNKTEFYQPNLNSNWNKLMKQVRVQTESKQNTQKLFRWVAAAAILVVVFLTGMGLGDGLFIQSGKLAQTKIVAPEGSKTQISLPDGTQVWLNSGSELLYSDDFSAKNRVVSMKGECFFDVAKDPIHPFLVRGSNFDVKVFGTRFNVNEDNLNQKADVTLLSGKIQVFSRDNKLISEIQPGEQLVLSDGKYNLQMAKNINALTAWLNNMLIFENQPFEEVIPYLEKWYGVTIHLDQSLCNSNNYTFKVKTESLREVLELISVITPIEYQIEGEQVSIKYKTRNK